jgi:hypothetical protein
MSRLEDLDGSRWERFLGAGVAVLVLGRSDCEHCREWAEALSAYLDADASRWPQVRFGRLLLDTPGLASFKRANPWVAELDMLPVTLVYRDGERQKEFAGGGVARLESRLRRVVQTSQPGRLAGGP